METIERVLYSKNAYQILGLQPDASLDDAKKAYKELSRKLHPDKSSDPRATDAFQRIHQAYERLKDPIMRHMELGAAPGAEAYMNEQRNAHAAAQAAAHAAAASEAHEAASRAQREAAARSAKEEAAARAAAAKARSGSFTRETAQQRQARAKQSKEERMKKEREVGAMT